MACRFGFMSALTCLSFDPVLRRSLHLLAFGNMEGKNISTGCTGHWIGIHSWKRMDELINKGVCPCLYKIAIAKKIDLKHRGRI